MHRHKHSLYYGNHCSLILGSIAVTKVLNTLGFSHNFEVCGCLSLQGTMQVWGFAGTQADRNTISALALQADQHGNIPLVLQLLGSLDVDQDDFTFHIGEYSSALAIFWVIFIIAKILPNCRKIYFLSKIKLMHFRVKHF